MLSGCESPTLALYHWYPRSSPRKSSVCLPVNMCLYRVWTNSPLLIYLSVLLRAVCGVPFHNHKYLCQYPYVFISLSLHYFIISTHIDLSICILFSFYMHLCSHVHVHGYLHIRAQLPPSPAQFTIMFLYKYAFEFPHSCTYFCLFICIFFSIHAHLSLYSWEFIFQLLHVYTCLFLGA